MASNNLPLSPEIKFDRINSRENKPLNLFTGLYYHISVKSIPNGILTFESNPREEGNLIQLALNDLEDFDLDSLSEGNGDGPLSAQALWTLLPELGQEDSQYQLKVLSHPEGKLTYTHGCSWHGRYMELDLSNPENYNPGANMYSSCLWHLKPSEFSDYFTIHNSDPRRDPNFVTFSNEPSERGQLMQLGTKELDHYDIKGVFRQDALWNFKPKSYQLSAFITKFQFQEPSDTEISEEVYPISIMQEILSPNDSDNNVSTANTTNKIDFTTQLPETFKLNFLQSFKPFLEQNITIDPDAFSGKTQLKFLQGKEKFQFEKKYNSNTQFVCFLDTEYKIQQDIQFPEDCTKLKVKGYCSVVKELDIPFTARVDVMARGACVDSNIGLKVENTIINSRQVVEYLLKYERFTGKVVTPNPSKDKKKDDISKISDSVVQCEVSGSLKCTCGLDTYIDVRSVDDNAKYE